MTHQGNLESKGVMGVRGRSSEPGPPVPGFCPSDHTALPASWLHAWGAPLPTAKASLLCDLAFDRN